MRDVRADGQAFSIEVDGHVVGVVSRAPEGGWRATWRREALGDFDGPVAADRAVRAREAERDTGRDVRRQRW